VGDEIAAVAISQVGRYFDVKRTRTRREDNDRDS
jgi:hypothetical protein